jgi:hypothetical protein
MKELCDNSKVKLRGHFVAPNAYLLKDILDLLLNRDEDPIPYVKSFLLDLEQREGKYKAYTQVAKDYIMNRGIQVSISIYNRQKQTVLDFLKAYTKLKMGAGV